MHVGHDGHEHDEGTYRWLQTGRIEETARVDQVQAHAVDNHEDWILANDHDEATEGKDDEHRVADYVHDYARLWTNETKKMVSLAIDCGQIKDQLTMSMVHVVGTALHGLDDHFGYGYVARGLACHDGIGVLNTIDHFLQHFQSGIQIVHADDDQGYDGQSGHIAHHLVVVDRERGHFLLVGAFCKG